MRRCVGWWSLMWLVVAGCGDCGDTSAADRGDLTGDSGADGVVATDGSTEDRDGSEADDGVVSNDASADRHDGSGPVDGGSDGGCQTPCSGKQICTEGDCACPRYHERCGGECVAVHTNPDHCGTCDHECSGDEACSAGTCSTECLSGRTKCGNECVDRQTDARHCGGCNNPCPSGEGCVDGTCEPSVSLDAAPAKCEGGGPQIEVSLNDDSGDRCLGDLAQRTFKWALCSCDDLIFGNKLVSDAYDSTLGRYEPGGLGGSIGANGRIHATDQTHVWGATWTSAAGGFRFDNKTTVELELHSGGDAIFDNDTTVSGDARIEGDVGGKGDVQFEQTLLVDDSSAIGDNVSYNNLTRRQGVDVPTVCERCDPTKHIPVESIVADRRGSNNDNGAIGLDPDVLDQPAQRTSLELPCGEYYLSNIDTEHKISIIATGRTALFIDGDVWAKNKLSITPVDDAELDVFIAGDVEFENDAAIGSSAYPSSMRFYVGGDEGWKAGNKIDVGAYIYALPGGMQIDDKLEVFGGLYTDDLDAGNDVTLHYDRAVLGAGQNCPTPDIPPVRPESDAGGTDDADARQSDAGGGPELCGERDEACSGDGDCCSPLICTSDGTCGTTSCKNLYESCENDGDCCSGNCANSDGRALCHGS